MIQYIFGFSSEKRVAACTKEFWISRAIFGRSFFLRTMARNVTQITPGKKPSSSGRKKSRFFGDSSTKKRVISTVFTPTQFSKMFTWREPSQNYGFFSAYPDSKNLLCVVFPHAPVPKRLRQWGEPSVCGDCLPRSEVQCIQLAFQHDVFTFESRSTSFYVRVPPKHIFE